MATRMMKARQCAVLLTAGVTLAGCLAAPAKKNDVLYMYELPSAQSARPGVLDNDSYYRQPTVYKGCTQINDAPSCGGG